jgi:hypothetical protein
MSYLLQDISPAYRDCGNDPVALQLVAAEGDHDKQSLNLLYAAESGLLY